MRTVRVICEVRKHSFESRTERLDVSMTGSGIDLSFSRSKNINDAFICRSSSGLKIAFIIGDEAPCTFAQLVSRHVKHAAFVSLSVSSI